MREVVSANTQKILWHVVAWTLFIHFPCNGDPPPCFSDIYCYGPLLDTIQMAQTFEDSKTFVDMKMKNSPQKTKESFKNFMEGFTDSKPTKKQLHQFVYENFELQGNEFEDWKPTDWTDSPKFLDKIIDPKMRMWASRLNRIWNSLGRKIKDDVKGNQNLYSLIWLPNPSIVPGGRFREFYYWDTYWIIKGLLLSEMVTTVKGILENFLYMVNQYGFVPNGGRIYYLGRSQPPLLIPMVKLYYDYTHDKDFLADNMRLMEKEFDFWMTKRTKVVKVKGVEYTLALYGDQTSGPRPESYVEDVTTAKAFTDESEKNELYSQLKSAAESGWDFSSRWFVSPKGTNSGNLTNIKIKNIVPVDLNAIIYWNAKILSEFHGELSNQHYETKFNNIATKWLTAVTAVLWHEDVGVWLDYDLINNIRRHYFSPANIFPLWTGCYNSSNRIQVVEAVLRYLRGRKFLYPGGVPTTLYPTGEQWDFPNAWPPLQHVMIVSLENTGHEEAMELAFTIARTWIDSNFAVYNERGDMFEKYDVTVEGSVGCGGEYEVQLGFGWTNAVILDLLNTYGEIYISGSRISIYQINTTLFVVELISLSLITYMTL